VEPTAAAKLVATGRVLVIAHRGDSKVAPENTLPAFASAVKVGADLVELDYFHSADGVPVVFHDKDLDRTTNAKQIFGQSKIPISTKTLDELRRLDAGLWFDRKFTGTKIPTLEEALDTIQAGSVTLIEHKGGDAATCIELLKRKEMLDKVVVQSFDWQYVRDCHRLAPQLTLAALGSNQLTPAQLDQIQLTGAKVVGWNEKYIRKQDIDAIHRRGLKAWVYTVDDPRRANQLIADGIDGIITNTPAAILKLVNP
jgi:glycerophosphoryl diester phosphodiesterase